MASLLEDTRIGQFEVTVLEDFQHPALDARSWDGLLTCSTDVVFMTLAWQREWWRTFGGDRLLVVLATLAGKPVAIAPLFAAEGMLFIVGSGGSDYLDFIGELDESLLATMLQAAQRKLSDFAGIGLYHVPVRSRTTALLPGVSARLGLELFREGEPVAPYLDLTDAAIVTQLVARRSVRVEEARMRRLGELRVRSAESEQLDEWLEAFFAQHSSRWRAVGEKGLEGEQDRAFCRAIVHRGHRERWLRFTMLEWRGAPAAFDISLLRGDCQLCYLVSRDPTIRTHSPGRVLQAHVIKQAADAGARRFDFGLGDEEYKLRAATAVTPLANWFLYPA